MRTRDEIERDLQALGVRITAGPVQTASGWEATFQRGGGAAVKLTGRTELGVLEDMLRDVQRRQGGRP